MVQRKTIWPWNQPLFPLPVITVFLLAFLVISFSNSRAMVHYKGEIVLHEWLERWCVTESVVSGGWGWGGPHKLRK